LIAISPLLMITQYVNIIKGDKLLYDTHHRIPPTWHSQTYVSNQVEHLKVIETAITEPTCKDTWCALNKGTIKFSGPVEVGTYTDASGTHDLNMDWEKKAVKQNIPLPVPYDADIINNNENDESSSKIQLDSISSRDSVLSAKSSV